MSAAEPRQPSPAATAGAAPRPESLHSAEDTKGEASENRKEADDVGVALLAAVVSPLKIVAHIKANSFFGIYNF